MKLNTQDSIPTDGSERTNLGLNETLRFRFGKLLASAEMCSTLIASYVPNNSFRIQVLRIFGAQIGHNVAIEHGFQVRYARRLTIGSNVLIAQHVILDARGTLTIGDNVGVNSYAQVWTAQHEWQSADFAYVSAPVHLGNHSWINTRAIILPGADIGTGTVVAAGSVVTKSVGEYLLVGGVPAKTLGERRHDLSYEIDARRAKAWWW
ncbi:MAG: acyltransferase [Jatrophihabitans sp.]